MKISEKLPQFKNEKALLMSFGKQEGVFYLADNGNLKKLKSFSFSKPKYSDREGFFVTRGKAGTYEQGAVYEPKKERVITQLENKVEEETKNILDQETIDAVYLSCPEYLKNRIKKSLPSSAQKKIKTIVFGDYLHSHPFELLERIKEKKTKNPVKILSSEAAKILKKTKQARKTIKGK